MLAPAPVLESGVHPACGGWWFNNVLLMFLLFEYGTARSDRNENNMFPGKCDPRPIELKRIQLFLHFPSYWL